MKEVHTIYMKDEELVNLNVIIEEQYKQRFYLTSVDTCMNVRANENVNIFTFEKKER